MYIAGQNVGSATLSNDLGAAKPFVMGNNYDNNNGFIGNIDDFVIYKGSALRTANFTPPTTEAIGNQDTVLVSRFNGPDQSTDL